MHMRRFIRFTNAFSKKIENHCYAIALHFVYYNFVKIHKTLRVPLAMEDELIKLLIAIEEIIRMTEKWYRMLIISCTNIFVCHIN